MSFRGKDGKRYAGWEKPVSPPDPATRPAGLPRGQTPFHVQASEYEAVLAERALYRDALVGMIAAFSTNIFKDKAMADACEALGLPNRYVPEIYDVMCMWCGNPVRYIDQRPSWA